MEVRSGIILAALVGFSPSARADAEVEALFKKDFPAAAKRLEAQFARVQGSCRLWTVNPRDSRPLPTKEGRFVIDHGYEKVTIRRTLPVRGAKSHHIDNVYCVGVDTAFTLVRLPGSKEYMVEGIGSTLKDRSVYLALFGQFIRAHHGVMTRTMSQVLASPGFRLTNVERVTKDGRSLVKIDFEIGTREPLPQGSIVFDPDAGWVVRSSDFHYGASARPRFVTDIEYGPSRDGFPLPRRVSIRDETGETLFCEFADWSFEPTPEREFKMAFYGLPDLLSKSGARRSALPYWLGGIAATGLAVAFLLRRFASRDLKWGRA